MIEALVPAVFY